MVLTRVKSRNTQTQIRELASAGSTSADEFMRLLTKEWALLPVLQLVESNVLIEFVLSLSNDELRSLNSTLGSRYASMNIAVFLSTELEALQMLKKGIAETFSDSVPVKIEQWMRQHVIGHLDKAIQKLGNH